MTFTTCKARFKMDFLSVTLVVCMMISQTEGSVLRVRRQGCQDGTYDHDGRTCCKCPAGFRVEVDCTGQFQTVCEPCEHGKGYQSHANSQKTCEPCTSCEQPNANLEVDRQCTPVIDSTCKCKENHYCLTGRKPCKICEPCQVCDSEGIRVACSATNNTICNDKPQENNGAMIWGILGGIAAVVVLSIAASFWLWKKIRSGRNNIKNGNEEMPEEGVPLQPDLARLGPHIPDIAEVIGWTVMRNLAGKSNIPEGKIQSCELDHPNNSIESTIALLRIWEEKESSDASRKLIEYLRKTKYNNTADKVQEILCGGSS